MIIKEITESEFDTFASNHILGSIYQNSSYGSLMNKYDYKAMYIGAFKDETLISASLILTKTISINVKYGYSPRGFLIDYFDEELMSEFTEAMIKFFNKKGFAFIKINPIITYAEINPNDNTKIVNELALKLFDILEKNNYKKLKDNVYFESILPKYNPIINLKNFSFDSLDKKLQNKLTKVQNKGLSIYKGDIYNINTFYELVKGKDKFESDFYKNLYKYFNDKNMVDLFLIDVNYHEYLIRLQMDYSTEKTINEKINNLFVMNPNNKAIYNEKMASDKKLNEINTEISETNNKIQNEIYKETVAAALVMKHKNTAFLYESGFNKYYNRLLPNHYMHYKLLEHYKKEGKSFMDLNGITGDFSKNNPYKGLNEFKLSWNPKIFEYVGEFDLIVNQNKYSLLWSTKTLHKEFEKPGLKNTD